MGRCDAGAKSDAIDIVYEDLYVSADRIRARYVFRNRSKVPVETIVAFPMPDRNLAQEYGGNVAYPSDFQTSVNGLLVRSQLERNAMANGQDQRALLEQLNVPVVPYSINQAMAVMDRLPEQRRRRLIDLGLAGEEEWDDDGKGMKKHLIPLWTVQDKYWWKQRFPAGKPLKVEHSYAPGTWGIDGNAPWLPELSQ